MNIRRFVGKDYRETVELVKKELGADAVILSAQTLKKGFGLLGGRVEITAARDTQHPPRPAPDRPAVSKKAPTPSASPSDGSPPFDATLGDAVRTGHEDSVHSVLSEVRRLREDLMPFLRGVTQQDLYPLVRRGVDEQLAAHLVEKAGGTEPLGLKQQVCRDLRVARMRTDERRVQIFVGPTGVGKTTTLAKVAAGIGAEGKKAMITTFDSFRPGGTSSLKSYAGKLGMPFKALQTSTELFALLTHSTDPILVDTPGRSPGDEAFLDGLLSFQFTEMPINTHLLLGANADPEVNLSLVRRYEPLQVDSLVFTKVDEAVRFGSLYNLAVVSDIPVAYVTNGQRVPDDIRSPSSMELAHLILEGELTC